MRTPCQRIRWLRDHVHDYADTDGKLRRPRLTVKEQSGKIKYLDVHTYPIPIILIFDERGY